MRSTKDALTADEVAALSDADLSQRVAVECYGARILSPTDAQSHARETVARLRGMDNKPTVWVDGAHYGIAVDPDAAGSVQRLMEHTRRLAGWRWFLESDDTGWAVHVYPAASRAGFIGCNETGDTMGRAVFEAALRAAQKAPIRHA